MKKYPCKGCGKYHSGYSVASHHHEDYGTGFCDFYDMECDECGVINEMEYGDDDCSPIDNWNGENVSDMKRRIRRERYHAKKGIR